MKVQAGLRGGGSGFGEQSLSNRINNNNNSKSFPQTHTNCVQNIHYNTASGMATVMRGRHSQSLPLSPPLFASVHLPITVYAFDERTKKYRLVDCLQCAVPCAKPPKVLNCNAGLGMLGENLELLKAAMQTPAIILRHGKRSKTLSASGDEVVALPPTQR